MMLVLRKSEAHEVVLKKIWALPELRYPFSIVCQLRSPFLVLAFKVNPDSKNERVSQFSDLSVSEKTSGKILFKRDMVMPKMTIEDTLNVVEKINNLTEDTLRVEGTVEILKRNSSKSYQFEVCVPAAITEDSMDEISQLDI